MSKIDVALAILRDDELSEELVKSAGFLRGAGNVLKAVDKAGQAPAQLLRGQGHEHLARVARVSPYAAIGYGGKEVNDTDTVQGLKHRYRAYKIRKAMETLRRGQQ